MTHQSIAKRLGVFVLGGFVLLSGMRAEAATFTVVEDAGVKKSSPTRNYEKSSRLEIDGNGSASTHEAYLKFSLTGISGAVTSAKLRVFVRNGSKNGPALYTTDSSWTEAGLKWNGRPAPSTLVEDKASIRAGWAEYNVTAFVKTNGTLSFLLTGSASDGTDISSREGENPAELVVETAAAAPAPSPKPSPSPSPSVSPAPVAKAIFTSIGSTPPTIAGKTYSVQSALQPHSIQRSQNAGIYRFEVREGEAREGKDEGKERSELSGGDYRVPVGKDFWVAYSFMVEPGERLPGTANVLGQFHAGTGSPNLSFRLPTDELFQVVLRVGSAKNYDQFIPYEIKNFTRGKWYHMVIHARFSPKPDAVLRIWIDGKPVVNQSNFVMGYDESAENYWKFGIYRSESVKQVEAVQYSNMEMGTVDLSARVANPIPVKP